MYQVITKIETGTKTIKRNVTVWNLADLGYEKAYSRSLAPRGSVVDIRVNQI